jgi:hypothetical protein
VVWQYIAKFHCLVEPSILLQYQGPTHHEITSNIVTIWEYIGGCEKDILSLWDVAFVGREGIIVYKHTSHLSNIKHLKYYAIRTLLFLVDSTLGLVSKTSNDSTRGHLNWNNNKPIRGQASMLDEWKVCSYIIIPPLPLTIVYYLISKPSLKPILGTKYMFLC